MSECPKVHFVALRFIYERSQINCLEFLTSFLDQMDKPALQLVLARWCDGQHLYEAYEQSKISIVWRKEKQKHSVCEVVWPKLEIRINM